MLVRFHKLLSKVYPQICPWCQALKQINSGENASKKKMLVEWNSECQEAFSRLKALCCDTPVLAYANYSRPFNLHTDASEVVLGAMLYQAQGDGTERVIAYASSYPVQI